MADPTARINSNKGGIAPLITTEVSVFDPVPYEAVNIFAIDDSPTSDAIGQPAGFDGIARFPLRKRGGRVGHTYLEVDITVNATPNIANVTAAWVDDLGAALIEEVKVKYSSKDVQTYRGNALKNYQRLMDHDITKEHYNGNQFAGLNGPSGEALRSNTSIAPGNAGAYTGLLVAGQVIKLRVAMDWIWWTKEYDQALATEALASEIIVEIKYRRLEELIYARSLADPYGIVDPFAVPAVIARPTITRQTLNFELVFTPKVEASKHLAMYENRRGLLFKILDFEEQLNHVESRPTITAAPVTKTLRIPLNNFRLDSSFLFFSVRDGRILTPWAVDRTSSDDTSSRVASGLLSAVANVAVAVPIFNVAGIRTTQQSGAQLPISRFRLTANGSVVTDWCSEFENRGMWRKKYFPGSQISGAVYFIPFGVKLREHRNVFGYQNMANLGNLVLEIEIVSPGTAALTNDRFGTTGTAGATTILTSYNVDVFNVCHNVVQMAQGDIIKALR